MRRRILVLVAALIFAAAGTAAVLAYVGRADARALAGQEPTEVVVTTAAIPRGTTVETARSAGLLETTMLPRRSVPSGAMLELSSAEEDLVAASDVGAGEVVLRGRFVEKDEIDKAGAVAVPDGKLAVSVELSDPGRVGAFVRPGSEVAVFHYREASASTRALLPRVLVVGVGASTEDSATQTDTETTKSSKSEKAVTTAILTLAVDERQAEQLVHASYTGELHFGLLDSATAVTKGSGVDDKTLYN
jgi:pilus assembly protein CpaB